LEAKGSVSGMTPTINRGINIMKKKSTPARRFRSTQPRNRAIFGFISMTYQGLTDPQMDAWEAYAQNHPEPDGFGGTFIPTGHQAYVGLNHTAVRLDEYAARNDDPPVLSPVAALDTMEAVVGTVAEGDIIANWTYQGAEIADDFAEIRIAGPFHSRARKAIDSRFKFLATVPGDEMTYTAENLIVGMWYWLEVRYVSAAGQPTVFLMDQMQPFTGP